jgi:two-component system sensor histidine kinase QseC
MRTIRQQLTRKLLGAVLLILLGGLTALYFGAREAATDQFDRTIYAKGAAISTLVFQTKEGFRFEFTDRFMKGFEDYETKDFFQLWTSDGREIARSESLVKGQDLPRRTGTIEHPAEWNFTLPNGRPGRAIGYSFRPKASDRSLRGQETELLLVVASDREELEETLMELLAISGGWCLLLIGVTVWVIPRVLRSELLPLDQLGEQAARIDADSLSTRFGANDLPQELRPIAEKLNDAFARLQRSFERERRFSADLAHELRTPLAELRSMAECAIKWPESRDPTLDQEVVAIARQMEQIVTNILALVRGEQGQLQARLERTPVAPLITQTWKRYSHRAAERNIRTQVALDDDDGLVDPILLRSILDNLFDNAVDYAPAGGVIEIAASRVEGKLAIIIANTAADLEPGDVPKMFDRFWRKEASRSGGLHVGLGLSLSKAYAEAMHWSLTATLEPDRRLIFRLKETGTTFPAGSKTPPAELSAAR